MRKFVVSLLCIIGTLVAALVAIPAYAAHTAVSLPAPRDPLPKGVWNVTVSFPDHSQRHALEMFFPETAQKAALQGGPYMQTDSQGVVGLGDWEQTSSTTFEVVYVKQVVKPGTTQKAYLGTQHVHCIDQFMNPTYYTGRCEIVQRDPTGSLVSTSTVKIQAVFEPDSDPNWIGD